MDRRRLRERERVGERRRKTHPTTSYDYKFIAMYEDRERLESLPRVFKLDLIEPMEWSQIGIKHKKKIFGQDVVYQRLSKAPLYTLTVDYQVQPPHSPRRGAHRHIGAAQFYLVKGKGYEEQEGLTFEFQEGDLFSVPPYTVHKHHADPEVGYEAVVVKTSMRHYLGIYWWDISEFPEKMLFLPGKREPIYDDRGRLEGFRIVKGHFDAKRNYEVRLRPDERWDRIIKQRRQVTRWEEEPRTTYDYYLKLLAQENQEIMNHAHVIKGEEVPWENTRQGKIKYLVGPNSPVGKWSYEVFVQEIPPGSRSGKHLHISEELHFILEGKGYDIQDEGRYDWGKGDLVCIPVGTEHQHFNSDPQRPARFVAFQPRFWASVGYGGFLQLEDAPEYG